MGSLEEILRKKVSCKSVWFMRQAGRYLPEFREIRKNNKNFIKLCLNSELSSKITLQPIERFGLDSAIIFSDILVVPFAMGQDVDFTKEHGPILSDFNIEKFLDTSEKEFIQKLNPVYKAIEITRKKLDSKKSLICFIGAPWTLLTYILKAKSKNEFYIEKVSKQKNIFKILEKLIKYLNIHIENQIIAGANVVQIFDSWAGKLIGENLKNFCYYPNSKIIEFCKKKNIPNICFPKGINQNYKKFNEIVKPDCINIDPEINPEWIKSNLNNTIIQGGLDPRILLKTEKEMYDKATIYLKTFKDIPYVFNLGHGLLPETNPDKVDKLIKFYRNYK